MIAVADTLEFLRTDADLGCAAIISELEIDMAIVGRTHHPPCFKCSHGVALMAEDAWLSRCFYVKSIPMTASCEASPKMELRGQRFGTFWRC